MDRFERCAAEIQGEHENKAPYRPFAADHGILTLEDAYDAQDALVRRRAFGHGAGYKIGLTSPRMQAMCGIDQPFAGVIRPDRLLASGAQLDLADFGRLGIEFEIAVRVKHDLAALDRPLDIDEIARSVEAVAPAVELIDDRNADYGTLDVLSLVADNGWNAGVVLGEFRTTWPDLAGVGGRVTRNGEPLDRGQGADVMGHPFASLAWLVNHLGRRGQGLRADAIVMTGSIVTTKFPQHGEHYRFELDGLGAVELSIA